MQKIPTIFVCFLVLAAHAQLENGEDSAENTFEYIKQLQSRLKLTGNPNITLVIGNTGSGISTLVHYAAGDCSKMISSLIGAEYIIYDGLDPDINKNTSTTVSRTTVPEMVEDETGNVWYACPGFADTRSEVDELATTFLMKSVLENASNVKIVLVINQGSFIKGYDRVDFDNLLTRTTQLITNIDRYRNSVSMVLTKAAPMVIIENGIYRISRDRIKEDAAQYMRDHRTVLEQNGSSEEKIKLIDALLDQAADKTYRKLSIFWRPTENGRLDRMPIMIEGRKEIRKSIREETTYTAIETDDFDFTFSERTRQYIEEMTQSLKESLTQMLNNMDSEVQRAIQHQIETLDLGNQLKILSTARKSIRLNITTLRELMQRYNVLSQIFNLTADDLQTNFNRIDQQVNNLNILTTISAPEFTIDSLAATSVRTIDYITAEQWYSFLEYITHFLASYDVQSNIDIYNVADLSDWGVRNKRQGLYINENNFKEFAEKFPDVYEPIPTEWGLEVLNEIIKFALQSTPQYECTDGTITIQGNILRSNYIEQIRCSLHEYPKIKVFVAGIFYVDSDLNLVGSEELEIFADTWIILQLATFRLNGKDGEAQSTAKPGSAGNPGNSGTNAANFFGFSNKVVNGDSLTIRLNGGDGGNGQNGGRSNDAEVSISPRIKVGERESPYVTNPPEYLERTLKEGGYKVDKSWGESYAKIWGHQYKDFYYVYPAACCGKTGTGGPGGLAGSAGDYKFIQVDVRGKSAPFFVSRGGSNGATGRDAEPCQSSGLFIGIETEVRVSFFGGRAKWVFDIISGPRTARNDECPTKYARTGDVPAKPSPHKPLQFTFAATEYKKFLRKNMKYFPNLRAIQKTYAAIDSDPDITGAYSLVDLVVELNALEKQYYELKDHVDLLPYYEHFLKWIENFAAANIEKSSGSDRKVIRLLYTTTLSKIVSIRSGHESDLIIDIKGFFELIEGNINELDDIGRINMIHQYRDEYNDTLTAKIDEATNFIENDVQPEIKGIFSKIDENMEGVVAETIELQDKTKKEIDLKKENEKKMKKNMIIRTITGVFNVAADCAALSGPEGKAAAAAIKTGTTIVNGFITDPPINTLVMPDGVVNKRNKLIEMLKKQSKQKLEAIEGAMQKLNSSLSGMSVDSSKLDELNKLLLEMKSINVDSSGADVKIEDIHARFTDFLGGCKSTVEAAKSIDMKAENLKSLDYAANSLTIIGSSVDVFKQFADDAKKLEAISKAIIEDQQTLIALKMLELEIYAELIPMVNGLQGNLTDVESKLNSMSPVALDVQQWRIQSTLRSVLAKLLESISGFKNEFGIKDCFIKVEEAFNLVIKIFDRVQNYQEQSRFAEYLSDLQTASIRNLVVDDKRLEAELGDLRFNLQANIILSQYNRAIDAFKQVVFPFADDYVDIYQLPASFVVDKNLTDLVVSASGKVKSLSNRIKEMSATISQNDAIIETADFDRDHGWSRPFYVWPNNEVNAQIRKLFAGEKIYLLADVERSSNLNAVKFNVIDLAFYSSNQATNRQLKKKLKSFRIVLTHMGESNYRCNQNFYTISSRSQDILFSLGDKSYEPTSSNEVYKKLRDGNRLLSPYTLWAIELIDGQFGELEPFVDSVDIELRGRGQYVVAGAAVCNKNLQEHYSSKNAL